MSDNNKIINTTSSTTNNDFNPMPMDSKSYIDNKDFYTKSLLNQKNKMLIMNF